MKELEAGTSNKYSRRRKDVLYIYLRRTGSFHQREKDFHCYGTVVNMIDSVLVPKPDIGSRMYLPKSFCFDIIITGMSATVSMPQVKK
jgi:hypothetical protein